MATRDTPLERAQKKRWQAYRKRRRTQTILIGIVLTILGVGLAIAALPVFILLYGGLLPTLVAYLADEQPGRHMFRTVAFMNLAGIIPFIEAAWYAGNHALLTGALASLTTWIVIYVAALIGFVLYFLTSWFAGFVLEVLIRSRMTRCAAEREALAKEWDFDAREF